MACIGAIDTTTPTPTNAGTIVTMDLLAMSLMALDLTVMGMRCMDSEKLPTTEIMHMRRYQVIDGLSVVPGKIRRLDRVMLSGLIFVCCPR